MNTTNIFYTTGCPRCHVLKTKLDEADIFYNTCNDTNRMIALNIMSAPAFYTDETGLMDFGQTIKWIKEKTGNAN